MNEPITTRGTVLPDGTLRLDAPVTLPPGPVEVVVRPLPVTSGAETGLDVLLRFRAEDAERGPPSTRSAEEIDAHVAGLREEWEDRAGEVEAIREQCRRVPEGKQP